MICDLCCINKPAWPCPAIYQTAPTLCPSSSSSSLSCPLYSPQGLLPRGERSNPLREKNAAVNNLLRSALDRMGPVQFLDMSAAFLHSDGTVSVRDMFDYLHLTAGGYSTIATPLHELLLQLLDDIPQERRASLV